MITKKQLGLIALGVLMAINAAEFALATTVPTVTSGNITVTPTPGFVVSNATLNGVSCKVSGPIMGTIVNCLDSTIQGGSTSLLVLAMVNTAQVAQTVPTPTVTYGSSGTSTCIFLTVAPWESYPLNIASGATKNITFSVIASTTNVGTETFTLAP